MIYIPTQEDKVFAKSVYNEVIFTQVLDPKKVKEAFTRLFGYQALNANVAKRLLAAYFTYTDFVDAPVNAKNKINDYIPADDSEDIKELQINLQLGDIEPKIEAQENSNDHYSDAQEKTITDYVGISQAKLDKRSKEYRESIGRDSK